MKIGLLTLILVLLTTLAVGLGRCSEEESKPPSESTGALVSQEKESSSTICSPSPVPTTSLSSDKVKQYAEKIVVKIEMLDLNGTNWKPSGSGAIVAKEGNTYYVITANHVVPAKNRFRIITFDGQSYQIDSMKNPKAIEELEGGECVDLAVFQFTSQQCYDVAQLAENVQENAPVYILGWVEGTQLTFAKGNNFDPKMQTQIGKGCTSLAYDAETKIGMSGGPVLDDRGRLVGVHIADRMFGPKRGTSSQVFLEKASPGLRKVLKK